MTAGQVHESTRAESVIGQAVATLIGRRRKKLDRRNKPKKVADDKGYRSRRLSDWLLGQGIKPVIPPKENETTRRKEKFDAKAYCGRSVVEQCVGWMKECRRIGTRFEKLAINFHGMLHLAMIDRYLRTLFSDRA